MFLAVSHDMALIILLSIIWQCHGQGTYINSDDKHDIGGTSDDRESYRYNEYFEPSIALNILFITLCMVILCYKMRNCSIDNASKRHATYEMVKQQSESESDYDHHAQRKEIQVVEMQRL